MAGDYNGPESFWIDGWTYHLDPEVSDIAGLSEVAPQLDFLIHEAGSVQGFTELLEDPPLARSHLLRPSTNISWNADHRDPFSRPPTELRMEVLCLLSIDAAQAVRTASRATAFVPLGLKCWRSRFAFPHELCYIRLEHPPRFHTGPQANGPAVDGTGLCYWLLDSADKSWQNRERVMNLKGDLVMLTEDDINVEEKSFSL